MKWRDIKRKNLKEESCFAITIVMILLSATIDEIFVLFWGPKIFVLDYATVSLIAIQIQATIQTLSIALLALASGKMDESYMGINYNDFQFNIRPVIFTQKRLIIGSVLLLVMNLFLHMAGLYNAVVAVFMVACLLIVISAKEIYAVFTVKNLVEEEIESYILYCADGKMDSEKTIEVFQKLCKGWRRNSENQTTVEYEKYLNVYRSLFQVLIFNDHPTYSSIIERESSEIIKDFSKSNNQAVKERSLGFLNAYYEYLFGAVFANKEKAQAIREGTHVLHEVYFDVSNVISSCSLVSIESVFPLTRFVELCVLCNYWLGYQDGQCYELRDVEDLVCNLGYQLGKNGNQDHNDRYWGNLLKHMDTLAVWPKDVEDKPDVTMCNIKFMYAQALIRLGQFKLVKEYFYEKAVCHMRYSLTEHQAKLFLKVHCYVFYLAFYETTNCISEELIKAARKFLDDTKQYFKEGLDRVADKENLDGNTFVFDEDLMKNLWRELRPFEITKHDDGKILIMEEVVNDFVVFVAAYLSDRYYYLSILDNIISSENELSLYMRFFQNLQANEYFKKFLGIIDAPDKNPQILLSKFEKILKKRIKSTQMSEAQREYAASENEDVTRLRNDATKKVMEYLNQIFNSIISEKALDQTDIRIPVLRVNDFSSSPLDKVVDGRYNIIAQQVIANLCSILYRSGAVKVMHKSAFEDDMDYLKFLRSQEISLVIGSNYALRTKDYSYKNDLEAILDGKINILEGYTDNALLLKESSLHIYFQNIKIGVHSGLLADEELSYDSSNELYVYEVVNGIPIEFTKEELTKYLHDKRRIVDIVVRLSMNKQYGDIGYVLVP